MAEGAAYRASVLVVDDEPSIRESLRMILEYEGYRVDEAASGSEALTKIAARQPSALLLDIKMPEMDGLALLTAVRERGYSMDRGEPCPTAVSREPRCVRQSRSERRLPGSTGRRSER